MLKEVSCLEDLTACLFVSKGSSEDDSKIILILSPGAQPLPQDEEVYTRVLSVRRRSGAVLALESSAGEAGHHIAECLSKCLSQKGLLQVQHIATDAPSAKLLADLQVVCPNLTAISLDPTHAGMKYEQAFGGKRSHGSSLLRRLLVKFTTHDPAVVSNIWGPYYAGGGPPSPWTEQEKLLRCNILDGSMSLFRARRVLKSVEALLAWPTRIQFLEGVAALAAMCSQDLSRKVEGTKLTVAKLLHSITAADKLEYQFNNLRYRQFLPAAVRTLMPSGTTSNEALHAELNAWYRQVQQLHRSTLCLKLRVQSFGKLLSHQTAFNFPTTAQLSSQMVLAGAATKPLWTQSTWLAWVKTQRDFGRKPLPLQERKAAEKERIKARKRPAAEAKPPSKRKRTAFTLPRTEGIRRSGIHRRNVR